MPTFTAYKLIDACREQGCPVCRLEQQAVERYLDSHLYENVNSPKWRDQLRGSLGFCHEHAWLAVDKRLGDALGFTIIYHDLVNAVLRHLNDGDVPARAPRGWGSLLRQVPEQTRNLIEQMVAALTPRKHCSVCTHREDTTRNILSALIDGLKTPELTESLRASDGLCLPHLRLALGHVKDVAVCEALLSIHRQKLEGLKAELAEFIRKNDYQHMEEGFGKERDAWLRAIGLLVGSRKGR